MTFVYQYFMYFCILMYVPPHFIFLVSELHFHLPPSIEVNNFIKIFGLKNLTSVSLCQLVGFCLCNFSLTFNLNLGHLDCLTLV